MAMAWQLPVVTAAPSGVAVHVGRAALVIAVATAAAAAAPP